MSRSRMGVGLEEPRGERSWLNKSWNSLQICLTRQKEGGTQGLPSVCFSFSPSSPSLFPIIIIFNQPPTEIQVTSS